MIDDDRLAKHFRIREHGKLTKVSDLQSVSDENWPLSHEKAQILRLKILFIEAKHLYNFALSFDFDTKIHAVNTPR